MSVATHGTASNYLQRAPSPSSLADVVDLILDKGLVIDAYVRVAVIGIELITIDARIVIASVDTYLRFAEAVNRLDLTQTELAGTSSAAPSMLRLRLNRMTIWDRPSVDVDVIELMPEIVDICRSIGAATAAAREVANRMHSTNGKD